MVPGPEEPVGGATPESGASTRELVHPNLGISPTSPAISAPGEGIDHLTNIAIRDPMERSSSIWRFSHPGGECERERMSGRVAGPLPEC